MATTVSLVKVFQGSTSYATDHESNYTTIETAINSLGTQIGGPGGVLSVPTGLAEIFDRNGIIGIASYKPVAATLSAAAYNVSIAAGAYWSGSDFRQSLATVLVSLLPFSTGTLYVNIDSSGIPTVSTSAGADAVWQFAWSTGTHAVTAVTRYSTCDVLFDGDDYYNSRGAYDQMSERFAAIEAANSSIGNQYAEDSANHSGLDFAYLGGYVHNDNVATATADGTVTLTNTTTNYIEVNVSTGVVSANTSGFTVGRIPLFTAVTSGGAIGVVTDKRTWARGGGSGSHSQNTDVGTDATTFTLQRTLAGAPSSNVELEVERGTSPNVGLRWNETDDAWEFTNDGTTWSAIGDVSGIDLGAQALTRYVAIADPDMVVEELADSTDGGYVQVNLGPTGLNVITDAPDGTEAVVLRVQFWDSAPGALINAKFREYSGFDAPTKSYTVWGGSTEQSDVCTIVVPADGDDGSGNPIPGFEYLKTASGAGTCNLRVFLCGYFVKVTGVGTQKKVITSSSNVATMNTSTQFNKTNFANRALIYKLKLTETGGTMTGLYDIEIYEKDTYLAADLVYQATGINPAASSRVYTDRLPFFYTDQDDSMELHLKIINYDVAEDGEFTIEVTSEQFA